MSLTNTICKNAKPKNKPYKRTDGKGMFLLINPNGTKYFRLNYRFAGKAKTLALGVYPEISLKEARDKRDIARKQLANVMDPGENRKVVKQLKAESAANSFEAVAREWGLKNLKPVSVRKLELYMFPWFVGKPINDIQPRDILACLRRIEDRGTIGTAHRTLQICGQVFRYGVATGRIERDITADLKGALIPVRGEHFAAITEPQQVALLLRYIDGYEGSFVSQCALKMLPLVFVRPGELRQAQWAHIDLKAKEWRYLVTKTDAQHIVPLSTQAVAILEHIGPVTGQGKYVFPSNRTPNGDGYMGENTLNAALKRLGYGKNIMTAHGFRPAARTILDEVLGFRPDFIEHQLAHAVRDPNGRAYNRTSHLPERHKMMQAWADYLDKLKASI